jgi:alpha-galactosidase
MPKITLLGAGSTTFAKNLIGDIFSYPELQNATITLFDIDEERLRTSEQVAQRLAGLCGAHPRIEATLDRRRALDGADYAISMFAVACYRPGTVTDFEIPRKYGLRQTIGDTLGIGGILRALRTIPVLLDMAREMEELCPQVTFLNYVNPMAMNVWALSRASQIKTIGLCHSVQGTAEQLANDLSIPLDEIRYVCAGINHMAFYLRFERQTAHGPQDLYPELRRILAEGRAPADNRVRYDALKHFGYFPTESSEHFAEYVPYYIKRDRPDLIEKFNIPLDEYLHRCELDVEVWGDMRQKIANPDLDFKARLAAAVQNAPVTPSMAEHLLRSYADLDTIRRSNEYGVGIIHSMVTNQPRVIYGNVPNRGLINNLPQGCIVEVPCLVDANGVQPMRVGSLPPQLAALMQTNVNVQALTVEAALTHKREHVYHAALLDPHTGAELDADQICAMVDDLLAAHQDWLPEYG